jgi:4'-phosphopantetheinyl transferase
VSSDRLIAVGSDEVHIWYVRFDRVLDEALPIYRGLMSEAERAQEARFHFQRDRRRHVVTRALCRTVLGRCTQLDPRTLQFTTNPYGRPELHPSQLSGRAVSFNISHTSDLAVLALAAHRTVGVDIENVVMRSAPLEIAAQCFSPQEVCALRALPAADQQARFFDYWTLKESYIKARGMGLSIPLERFSFKFPRSEAIELEIDPALGDRSARWAFRQYRIHADHILSVCFERRGRVPVAFTFHEALPLAFEKVVSGELIRACADTCDEDAGAA